MAAPTAVVFDYGHVLSLPQPDRDIAAMAELLCPDFVPHYWAERAPYDRGDLDGPQYWRRVAERCGIAAAGPLCQKLTELDTRSWSYANQPVLDIARRLPERGVKIAILSNMPLELARWVLSADTWLPRFQHHTFSCKVRANKPAPEIYQHCLEGVALAPEKVLFVDDRRENVEAAATLGMQIIWAQSTEQTVRDLRALFR